MKHKLKDPGSAITHLIGMILAAIVSIPLIIKSFLSGDYVRIISLIIFTISMIGLYGASTAYHSFNISPTINKKLKKLDHAMIFVLIAGSYTPICTIVLGGTLGYGLLSVTGPSRSLVSYLRCSGYLVRSGYLLSCISQWDGFVSLRSHRSSIVYPRHLLDGCLLAVSFIQLVV